MRVSTVALAVVLCLAPLSGCVSTVSPYGDRSEAPTAEATAYAETLLARPPATLTESERAFLDLYAQQAEARNVQARAQFEQKVFALSLGLSLLSVVAVLIERTTD